MEVKLNYSLQVKIKEQFGTQWRFAQEVGTHETVISKVLRGIRKLSEQDRQVWSNALKCNPDELFGFTTDD